MVNINSSELNYMIFRYLHESGFEHTAFNFIHESGLMKDSSIDANSVPPGALITFVQKGIQYIEMEANLDNEDVDEDFKFISPVDLLTKDVHELKVVVEEKKKQKAAAEELEKQSKEKEHDKGKAIVVNDNESDRKRKVSFNLADKLILGGLFLGTIGGYIILRGYVLGPAPIDVSSPSRPRACGVRSSDVLVLEGHTSEVSTCAWSPAGSLLASGSGDSTARIWTIADRTNRATAQHRITRVCVLNHAEGRPNEKNKDVSTLFLLDGTLLATGSCDGIARVWQPNGELKSTFSKHKGPIVCIKWSNNGDYLLTGSFDSTSIVWDVNADEPKQQFKFYSGPVLDVDWRTNVSFASGSADSKVYVCKIGQNQPVKILSGHKGEVNCVRWDPTASILASGSDDNTVKIWRSKKEKHVHDFTDHTKEIYTIRWSPTGPATANPNKQLLLASASYDATVKLWDVNSGKLLSSLNGHREAVFALSFSPNGEYVATGSLDRYMHVWSLKDDKIIKTYSSNGSIFDISWDKKGDKIAACTSNKRVCVLDFRM
ncbi:WD40 repeat-containing protein HOS15-like [Rutidosis leptorrhynchoides]|uniref:WD40 repeat-containing protein HOS15-like n=1 Tax=Rutidosis leptorrhynchoides TaxID=125765 RepID=UPI003A9A1E90